ncbi:MAG: hypothetical protein HQL45_12335 [Alphaproteobacteria bacterium]|nr:hypothetical protein [Alphaproteobacteria bacterium]
MALQSQGFEIASSNNTLKYQANVLVLVFINQGLIDPGQGMAPRNGPVH